MNQQQQPTAINPGWTKILIPPQEFDESNNLDAQIIQCRAPNCPGLYIDSTVGKLPTDNANSVQISTNAGNPERYPNILINRIRRVAVKDFSLFYYLDNIIQGYNDTFTMSFKTQAPDPPEYRVITVTIPPDVYTVQELGAKIEELLDAWAVANWGSVPIPDFTSTFIPPSVSDLYGQIAITATYLVAEPLLALDPNSTFAINSKGMMALTRSNNFASPTTPALLLSFFSDTPYPYIDVISNALTNDAKVQSMSNLQTNNRVIHRIIRPHRGFNTVSLTEPLNWFNMRIDTCLTQIDFTFLGPDGVPIRGAITRDFHWLCEISLQR